MSKIAHYLQEHLLGEVSTSADVRRHLAHDASPLALIPALAVYPRDENDVRKTARFCWQLAERGRAVPITARGGGSDTSGGAIGNGIIMVFTAHMHKILALDPKKKFVTVEPGATYDKVEQTLYTHGLFLPPEPASSAYATLGGGLATNAIGDRSVKYGNTAKYVKNLRVVLANGEVIETNKLSKRELSHKMGLSSFEGQIYRMLDALLEENEEFINRYAGAVGYNLAGVKDGGHFDLTPLFVGSQGSLGIITEATLGVVPHHPTTTLCIVSLNSLETLAALLPKILELKPSVCDIVNKPALDMVAKLNPHQLSGVIDVTNAAVHLIIEFDEHRDSSVKNLRKIVEAADGYCLAEETYESQQRLWKIRDSVSTILLQPHGQRRATPVAEDVIVPPQRLAEFMGEVERILRSANLHPAIWGHAGIGLLRLYPQFDLSQVGDRQAFFKISDAIFKAAVNFGGRISATGVGRIRSPFAREIYGEDFYNLQQRVKAIFDPHNMLNPGISTLTADDIKGLLRQDYSLAHRHEHLPRS